MVSGRETVLGSEAIFDGEDEGGERGGEAGAGGVEGGGSGTEEDEAAAVEVEDEGERGRGRGRGAEETDPGSVGGVERDVFRESGEGGVRRGGGREGG